MTVCIGAVCDNGKAIVVAADRMMTYGAPMNLQVETSVKKIVSVTESVVILFSGGLADGEDIIARTKSKIYSHKRTVQEISEATALSYQEVKRRRVEDTILKPFLGIDFSTWASILAQS